MGQRHKKNKYLCGQKSGKTMIPEKYVRFDWAVKTLLRDKSNFVVLEGLVSTILKEKISIVELLESESNQIGFEDKYNRVDIKAKDARGKLVLVEVQQASESDFLSRILYGSSKSIVEHIGIGDDYGKVKKIYSINIVYFNFGIGTDYLYHGQTSFTGVNTHDKLRITRKQRNALKICAPEEIFPEYYIVRVNQYDKPEDKAETPLEEWLDYLKNGRIKDGTAVPGLAEAREKLLYLMMSKEEQQRYFRYMDHVKFERNAMETSRIEGLNEGMEKGRAEGLSEGVEKGRVEGRAEGKAQKNLEIARRMLSEGLDIALICKITGLTEKEIEMTQ